MGNGKTGRCGEDWVSMKMLLAKNWIFPTLRSFFSPAHCEACQVSVSEDQELCGDCERGLRFLSPSHCEICALPFASEEISSHRCAECLEDPPSFDKVHALYEFTGSLPHLLRAGKFGKKLIIYPMLAQRGLSLFQQVVREVQPDYLVPMPLSWRRRWVRGFNQSYLLAKYLQKCSNLEIPFFLEVGRKHSAPQAQRDRQQRLRALKGVFSLKDPGRIKNKKLLLIDDILTTGATAQALSRQLKKMGAREVQVFVIGRVGKDLL